MGLAVCHESSSITGARRSMEISRLGIDFGVERCGGEIGRAHV